MPLFDGYEIVILDSSFFLESFSDKVVEGLYSHKVHVAESFNTELEQNLSLLTGKRKTIYQENIKLVQESVKPARLNFSNLPQAQSVHNDIWGLMDVIMSVSEKCVVLSADRLLIEKIIMENMKIDIYDLSTLSFIYHSSFPSLQKQLELDDHKENRLLDIIDVNPEDIPLYSGTGTCLRLQGKVNSGMEANLYGIQNVPNKLAKIFKKKKLSIQKYNNMKNTVGKNRKLQIQWAVFPEDILYYDPNRINPAGFIESYAYAKKTLDNDPLYLGNIDLSDEYLNKTVFDSLDLCIKVVRQIKFLNCFGFFVSDYTLGNFAYGSDSNYIQMWDTDSFGYGSYFSGYCDGNKQTIDYDITKKASAIDFCNECLYIFAYEILTLGDTPISEYSGKYKLENPNYPFAYRKNLIPDNLLDLFSNVFNRRKPASVNALLYELCEATKSVKSGQTYRTLLKDVIDPPQKRTTQNETTRGQKTDSQRTESQSYQSTQNTQNSTSQTSTYSGSNPTKNAVYTQNEEANDSPWIFGIIVFVMLLILALLSNATPESEESPPAQEQTSTGCITEYVEDTNSNWIYFSEDINLLETNEKV